MMLYFSYGSNMSVLRLKERASSATFVAVAVLQSHELRFHKKGRDGSAKCDAYATNDPEDTVMGVVFEIAETDKHELDVTEGLGRGYNEKAIEITSQAGELMIAKTYFATDIDPALRPFHWYKHHVMTGAIEHGLPAEYLKKISDIESIEDPDPLRYAREMAIYAGEEMRQGLNN